MINNVFFDFDGTLADTRDAIVRTTQAAFARIGLQAPGEEQIQKCIGLSLKDAAMQYPGMTPEPYGRFDASSHALFELFAHSNVKLYPDVADVLSRLDSRGFKLGIVTSRGRHSLLSLLDMLGIASFFDGLSTVENAAHCKPAPDTVLYLLDRLGLEADETLVVGDTVYDLLMGQKAGCRTCGVSYGNHSAEMLSSVSPDAVIGSFADLEAVIVNLNR